ncbi:cytochrome c family protein [Erythrobacter sp. NAP1]|uniref:c-type cytochrome n=1 Tax=Erythrobacter sp. NAP1 TaxID=237727 RepID=UPI000068511C|nr:c-type cytochrome [Erythrobacter sp. NAP1]EAQ27822.1 cytochrome c family protein [Erythrobacter sp. NAP1]
MSIRALGASGLAILIASASGASETEPPASFDPSDVAFGREVFDMCDGCHTVEPGGTSAAGPNLFGVVGRRAGSLEGYLFTEALASSEITWDAAHLDAYLADPEGYVPGTDMERGTVREPEFRRALIAYLSNLNEAASEPIATETGE